VAKCPNRNRKRALANNGQAGCTGTVQVIAQVPVTLTCKRIPRGSDGPCEILTHKVRRHGVRIPADTVARQVEQYRYDVVCDTCGWSLNRLRLNGGRKPAFGSGK
jgi:hypothetical protein